MGMLQDDKVIFYHPLNNATEYTQTQAWEGTADYGAGKVADAVKGAGGDPVAGSESECVGSKPNYAADVAELSSTGFVVVYRDPTDSNHGSVKVATVSGTDITFGPRHEFLAGSAEVPAVCALSATAIVVGFRDGGVDNHGKVVVGTVSGTDVTFGSKYEYYGSTLGPSQSLAALDSSHFIVCYLHSDDNGYGRVGHVAGTAVSFGSEDAFHTATTSRIQAASLSASSVAVCFRDAAASSQGRIVAGTVSGTTVSFGSEHTFVSRTVSHLGICALDSTRFVVTYSDQNGDDSYPGRARVGTVSGTDVTFGSVSTYAAPGGSGVRYDRVAARNSASVLVSYADSVDSWATKAQVGTVSGTDITWGSATTYRANAGGDPVEEVRLAALDPSHVASAYLLPTGGGVSATVLEMERAASLANPASDEATYGAAADYDTTVSGQQRSAVARLDDTHAIVCWVKPPPAGSKYGAAKVATISGSSVTFGSQHQFKADFTDGDTAIDVAALSSTKALIVYADQSDSGHGTAQVATISGNDITYGSEVEFLSETCFNQCRVAAIDSTRAIVVYRNASNHGRSKIATVSGSDVTFGSDDFWSGGASGMDVDVLSSTTVVIAYANTGTGAGNLIAATISGTDITHGGNTEFSASANIHTVSRLDATRALVTFQDSSNSYPKALVATVSGMGVSAGSVVTVESAACGWPFNTALSSTRGVVVYKDGDSKGASRVLTISGTGITVGPKTYFDTGSSDLPVVATMTSTKLAVSWQNGSPGSLAVGDALLGGTYPSSASASKVAFCGWFNKPS